MADLNDSVTSLVDYWNTINGQDADATVDVTKILPVTVAEQLQVFIDELEYANNELDVDPVIDTIYEVQSQLESLVGDLSDAISQAEELR